MKKTQDLKDSKDKIIEKSELIPNDHIIEARSKLWEKLKEIKEEISKSLPRTK